MGPLVYLLCSAAAFLCAVLLGRAHRRTGAALLGWSRSCFALLALGNALTFVDLVLLPADVDLFLWRNLTTLTGVSLLVFGLVQEAR